MNNDFEVILFWMMFKTLDLVMNVGISMKEQYKLGLFKHLNANPFLSFVLR